MINTKVFREVNAMSSILVKRPSMKPNRATPGVREALSPASESRNSSSDLSILETHSNEPEARELIRRAITSKRVRVVPDPANPERIRLIPCQVMV